MASRPLPTEAKSTVESLDEVNADSKELKQEESGETEQADEKSTSLNEQDTGGQGDSKENKEVNSPPDATESFEGAFATPPKQDKEVNGLGTEAEEETTTESFEGAFATPPEQDTGSGAAEENQKTTESDKKSKTSTRRNLKKRKQRYVTANDNTEQVKTEEKLEADEATAEDVWAKGEIVWEEKPPAEAISTGPTKEETKTKDTTGTAGSEVEATENSKPSSEDESTDSDAAETDGKCYYELKAAAAEYQEAKRILISRFEESGWGRWVGKPIEEDLFQ